MSGKSYNADDPQAESFAALFERSFDEVWRFVRRRVESRADADDVTGEVFAVAWRRRSESPPDHEQRLWLFGVARNVLRNHHRTLFRQRRVSNKVGQTAGIEDLGGEGPGERDDDIWIALSRLTEADRDLLLMRAWDGLAVGEIATLLNCSPNAVSVRLSKARVRLRQELEEKDCRAAGHESVDLGTERRQR